MKIKIKLRTDTGGSKAHYTASRGDERWSVLDCGELMKTAWNFKALKEAGLFLGWEAFPIKEDGSMDIEKQKRAESWEELEKLL